MNNGANLGAQLAMVIWTAFIFAVVCRKCEIACVDVLFKKHTVNAVIIYVREITFHS